VYANKHEKRCQQKSGVCNFFCFVWVSGSNTEIITYSVSVNVRSEVKEDKYEKLEPIPLNFIIVNVLMADCHFSDCEVSIHGTDKHAC
jgi:hypothetical protein